MYQNRRTKMSVRSCRWCVAAALTGACFVVAQADSWSAEILHPAGAGNSVARDVHGSHQVGWVGVGDGNPTPHAVIWNGSASSWVDLDPGIGSSEAYGAHGDYQAGIAGDHAALWQGTAASFVDLHPPTVEYSSVAWGVYQNQQVGGAFVDVSGTARQRASLWYGSAASWVNLHPGFGQSSVALSAYGDQQVGSITQAGQDRACVWYGSAASWVSLHPTGMADESVAIGVYDGQQVGQATISGSDHASLWSGTAESWVDLHPSGADASSAHDVYDGRQVGWTRISGTERATIWNGTAASWEDLHSFLPERYSRSWATGIYSDESFIYVSGHAWTSADEFEAVLWIAPVPEPTSAALMTTAGVWMVGMLRRRR